jgi:hypothetical protein
MPDIAPSLPVVGQPDATEAPKIVTALSQLIAAVNNVDTDQIADGTITLADLAAGASCLGAGLFSAYRSTAANVANGTEVPFDAELFDVSNWYDTTTGVFTPQQAGYYRLSAGLGAGAALTADNYWWMRLQKNAVNLHAGSLSYQRGSAGLVSTGTWVVQANGTTDAFRIVAAHNQGAVVALEVGTHATFFMGEFVSK